MLKKAAFIPILIALSLPIFALEKDQEAYLLKLIEESKKMDLAHKREWFLLLHYHQDLFGKWKSDVDGSHFFLTRRGRTHPQEELEATLKAFFNPDPIDEEDQHPQCKYPARYAWLKEKLDFDSALLPEKPCSRFESWKEKLAPESVTLIFASYYMNNPASMFGHTFLRLDRRGIQEGDLVDYTVNYAAKTDTNNGVAFALRGLFGGFPGTFSTDPYYLKIQKYNNIESRDLWEYKLDLSSSSVSMLVAHLWEMGPTSMAYYFTNKNCSYQLLPILEVANPRLQMANHFRFRAIPVDTMKVVLNEAGKKGEYNLRPSHMRQMLAKKNELTSDESKLAKDLVNRKDDDAPQEIRALAPDRRAAVLDASYDYLRYRKGFRRFPPETVQQIERQILLLRNELPAGTGSAVEVPWPEPPEVSHPSGRMDVGFGVTRYSSFEEINVRGAIHDLGDDPAGFVEGSELEMGRLTIRHDNDAGDTFLEKFRLMGIKSFHPWDDWVREPSWALQFGFETAKDLDRDPQDSIFFGLSGGSGLTVRLKPLPHGLAYAMVTGDTGLGGFFEDNYRLGLGGSGGIVFNPISPWRVHFSAHWTRYMTGDVSKVTRLSLSQAYQLASHWALRLNADRQNRYQELLFSLNRYF